MSAVRVSALTVRYGERVALADLDLDVPAGHVHGLVGPNGAGKTTLLRVLLGLLPLTSGEITIAGERRLPGAEATLRGVAGFVEAPRFWPSLTGRGTLLGLRDLDRLDGPAGPAGQAGPPDVDELLVTVGLADAAQRPVGTYSLGMRQRLAVAAALLRRPEVLLLDEPTSGLDPVGATELQALLATLAAAGTAVLLSSHDLLEVSRLCSSVTVLREGRVTFAGSLTELDARAPAPTYRLRTADDRQAAALAAGRGLAVAPGPDGLHLALDEPALDALVADVVGAGVALRELRVEQQPLEVLFRALTSGTAAPVPPVPPVIPPPETTTPVRATSRRTTRAGCGAVFRRELGRLRTQPGVAGALALCALAPFLFVAVLDLQDALPRDTLFGRELHASGYAVPLVVLGFAGSWLFPLLAGLVAGDVFSVEDHHGTWPLLLTRSRSRGELYLGKLLAALVATLVPVLVLAVASLLAGVLFVGTQPLVNAGGASVSGAAAVGLVAASWASTLPAVLAFTVVGAAISVRSRRSWVGVGGPVVLGLVLLLVSQLDAPAVVRRLLLSTPFVAWHGLATQPGSTEPILIGLATALGWALLAGALGWQLLVGRRGRGSLGLAGVGAVVAVAVALAAPGGRITAADLSRSLTTSIDGRFLLQQEAVQLSGLNAFTLDTSTRCTRPGRGAASSGPGEDWTCLTTLPSPFGAAPVIANYDLSVRSDGCYVATGPAGVVGPATLVRSDGTAVANPLYEFDGCVPLP